MSPYAIDGPTSISFSGGRTSAFMLRKTLDAHGGTLPAGAVVLFANTGKEFEETLEFVRRVGEEWSVPIVWVEFRPGPTIRDRWTAVDFETASRKGEPFEMLIEWKKFLPNPVSRFCTQHLKINAMGGYLRNTERGLGWESWESFIGIRHDEPRRWGSEGPDPRATYDDRRLPLRHDRVTEADVMEFWGQQPFDLGLKPWEGNCDLCYLKGRGKIERIIRDRPETAAWWERQEERRVAPFRSDRPRYSALAEAVAAQPMLPMAIDDEEDMIPCMCTD